MKRSSHKSGHSKREEKKKRTLEAAKDSANLQAWLSKGPPNVSHSNDKLEMPLEIESTRKKLERENNTFDPQMQGPAGTASSQEQQQRINERTGLSENDNSEFHVESSSHNTEMEVDDDAGNSIDEVSNSDDGSSSESDSESKIEDGSDRSNDEESASDDEGDECDTDSESETLNSAGENDIRSGENFAGTGPSTDEELIYFIPPQESDSLEIKQAFRKHHPIQPVNFKGKTPFNTGKMYYRALPNGQNHPRAWLSYSVGLNQVFCANCMAFGNSKSKFRTGCKLDIKNIYQDVERHEMSEEHKTATSATFRACQNLSIDHAINRDLVSKRVKEIEVRRQVVSRLIDITLFLARQGLAFRGTKESAYSLDTEESHGNFLELVLLLAEYDPILKEHVKRSIELSKQRKRKQKKKKGRGSLVTFLSKTFINKLIVVLGNAVQQQIFKDLKDTKNFSIMLDSTQDVAVMDQLAICARYVKNDAPCERLINLVICQDSTGEGLFNLLKREFDTYGLLLLDVIGCSFDGASNMAGIYEGLQAKIKSVNSNFIYTHCMAHVLNLVITDCTANFELLEDLLGLVQDSAVFLSNSHKKMDIWRQQTGKRHKKHDKLYTLHKIGATRWWSKHKAIKALFGNIDDDFESSKFVTFFLFLLEVIDSNFDGTAKFKARNLLSNWSKFQHIFSAIVILDLFEMTSPVSTFLQSKNLDYLQAWNVVDHLISQLRARRNDKYFEILYDKAKNFAKKINEGFSKNKIIFLEEDFPQKRVPLKNKFFDEKAHDEARNLSILESQRKKFFEVYDAVLGSLERRFVPNKELLSDISWLNPKNFKTIQNPGFTFPPDTFKELSKLAGVDQNTLTSEMKQFAGLYDSLKSKTPTSFSDSIPKSSSGVEELMIWLKDNDDDLELDEEENETEEVKSRPQPDPLKRKELEAEGHCIHCAFKILYELTSQTSLSNNLYIAYKYVLSLPCTQVTCERVFSKLKILKDRLRSQLGQDLLAPLMMLFVERDMTQLIDKNLCIDLVAATSKLLKRLLIV
nr:PREDICTED: uncharacterized protein LOC109042787 [Bemisia tabaci]